MAILNYTTTISAQKTAMEIMQKLSSAGAQAILTEYDADGFLNAMSFRILTPHGMVFFRLPAHIKGIFKVLNADKKVPKRLKSNDQAARVAWRILKDWIEAQLAMVETGMAELPEVFLPYAQDKSGNTVYQSIKNTNFKMLSCDSGV